MADKLPSNLCPIYKKALLEFREALETNENDPTNEIFCDIQYNFRTKYLMLSEDWVNRFERSGGCCSNALANSHIYYQSWRIKENDTFDEKHLYWKDYLILSFYRSLTFDEYATNIKEAKHLLKIPHANLPELLKKYKKGGAKPVTFDEKQQYEKALKLYEKFQAAGEDDEKWLNCIYEIEDEEAKIANIEFRLGAGEHYANVKIWKYYIEFMKTVKNADFLKIYQRYCRLFISDLKTRAEYVKEIERIGKMDKSIFYKEKHWEMKKITDYWFDVIDLERNFGTLDSAFLMLEKSLINLFKIPIKVQRTPENEFFKLFDFYKEKTIKEDGLHANCLRDKSTKYEPPKPKITSPSIYYQTSTKSKPQQIPFQQSLIYCITKNASGNVLHKLHKTCKYFFKLQPTPVCHRLIIGWMENLNFYDQSLFVNDKLHFNVLKNLFVSNTLRVYSCQENFLSKLSIIFYKCEASTVQIQNQKLRTSNDLIPFIKSGKVQKLNIQLNKICNLTKEETKSLLQKYGNNIKKMRL